MMLQAAFGKLEMTPPLEIEGSYRLAPDGRAMGVHDPLYARWMLLEQGDTRWCLLAVDVVLLRIGQANRWREQIAAAAGLPVDAVTVSCTHTHNGPDLPSEWGQYDRQWEAGLVDRIANDIAAGIRRLAPARYGWGQIRYDGAINRHAHFIAKALAEGNEEVEAALDPDARREYESAPGVVDTAMTVLRVDADDGTPLGHLAHYSGHCTTAMGCGRLLSADYPAYLLAETEARAGGVGLFLQGTAGNM